MNRPTDTGRRDHDQPVDLTGQASHLTAFVDIADRDGHLPLHSGTLHRAHRVGLSGATVLPGIEGDGASQHPSRTRLPSLSEGLPSTLIIIDVPRRIQASLPELDQVLAGGLAVIDEVTVWHDSGREATATTP